MKSKILTNSADNDAMNYEDLVAAAADAGARLPKLDDIEFAEETKSSRRGNIVWIEKTIAFEKLPDVVKKFIREKNKHISDDAVLSEAEVNAAIKSLYRRAIKLTAGSDVAKNLHKQESLTFTVLPLQELARNKDKLKIYKSATRGRQQSSEYYVAVIDGRLAYVRKSNHWGRFMTNIIGDGDEADGYGRVSFREYRWELAGAERNADGEYKNTSQAGYILLDTVEREEKEK